MVVWLPIALFWISEHTTYYIVFESCWFINKNAKSAAAEISEILSPFFLKCFNIRTYSKLKIKQGNYVGMMRNDIWCKRYKIEWWDSSLFQTCI